MTGFLLRILNKIGVLKRLSLYPKVTLNRKPFTVPVLHSIGLQNVLMTETWMIKLLEKLKPQMNGAFVDVGVNIGQTLLKVRSVLPNIEYIGFEPNPICVNYLSQLIKVNEFDHVTILPFGISNRTEIGTLHFITPSNVDSSASILADFRPNHKIEQRRHVSLYDLAAIETVVNFDKISILKIDVEGAELEVLLALEQLLHRSTPLILIEILPAYTSDNAYRISRQEKIEELMQKNNYVILQIIKNKNEVIELKSISTIEIHSDLNKSDYLMVQKEIEEQVIDCIRTR